jgi:glucose/arabinose dehydrogenase/cytochrome c5
MIALHRHAIRALLLLALSGGGTFLRSQVTSGSFHDAPASAQHTNNPYVGQAQIVAGKALYQQNCVMCHGADAKGTGNVPPLVDDRVQKATDGSIFWYITHGDLSNGMPAWAQLPEEQRWQLVSFVKSLSGATGVTIPTTVGTATGMVSNAPAPKAPFTDYRYEKPGLSRWITLSDLPQPMPDESATNGPRIVARPEGAWPKVPKGFKVELYAIGLNNPRLMRRAPNGDIFLAETSAGDIKVFHGMTADGKPQQITVFATGLNTPFGIAFYPLDKPRWVYVANMDSLVRFPYKEGDVKAGGPAENLDSLPSGGHHRSRDVQFSADGKKMFVSIGSQENVDDADATPGEKYRADILEYNPDGTGKQIYASGIRNPVGLAVNPITGELWCSVNERDGLGNNLVPDYITHVQPGGFYGWPWWYIGNHQDPRLEGKRTDLKGKVITPDVLLQPHSASLQMTFYDGSQFPAEYKGDIFAAEHGSWNRSPRAGYELIRVPLHQTGHAKGDYEDFMTGFVVDKDSVWGRPVGAVTAPDGSLLVSDDGSGSIWRITYSAK